MKFKYLWLAVFAAISTNSSAKEAKDLLVIEVNHGIPEVKSSQNSPTEAIKPSPVADGGELITNLNAVSGTRMGGRAIDPIIRGQKQTQLNVLLDGAYIHGGCPNRMDPPTSYSAVDSYDQVTVIKGNRSVVYGSGGSGGTIIFQRSWPKFDQQIFQGNIASSFKENGDRKELGADVAMGNQQAFIRLIGHKTDAGNYQDGNGDEVRSSYQSENNSVLTGWKISDKTSLQASVEKTSEEDVLFPGAGMDSPYADAKNYRISLQHQLAGKWIQNIKLEAYQTDVSHLMDNFRLRTPGSMQIEAPSTSDTEGGRLIIEAGTNSYDWVFGIDLQNNRRNATAINFVNQQSLGIQWPDAEINQQGIFAEVSTAVDLDNTYKAGVRFDHISAQAHRREELIQAGGLAGKTPQQVWGGKSGEKNNEDNLAGFASWTHRLHPDYTAEMVFSRSVRTADATERYMAMGKWRGNPDLQPEQHHQLELVIENTEGSFSWAASAWVNQVDDYILRFNNGTFDSYQNIDARLYGLEYEMNYQLNSNWSLATAIAWLKGKNKTDRQNLSQISPLEMNHHLDYQKNSWSAGIALKLVAQQNNVCLSSDVNCGGQDVQKTPGFAVVDLYTEYQWQKIKLLAGIDNLLDKNYRLHESRNDAFNPLPVQVTEPGRSVWLRAVMNF